MEVQHQSIISTSIESFELLSLCFSMFDIDDEQVKKQIQAQYLWEHTATDIPRAITLSKEALESRCRKAFWFAYHAALLQTVPLNQNELNISKIIAQKLIISSDLIINPQSLLELFKNISPVQLNETSEKMFQSAREIILDPLVYQQIPFNLTLVQSLFLMTTYLSTTGERTNETKMLLNAMKIFFSKERRIIKEVKRNNTNTEHTRDIIKQAPMIMKMSGLATGFEFEISTINGNTNTEKFIKKFLKRVAATFDLECFQSQAIVKIFRIKIDAGKRISELIRPPIRDADRLTHFMEETNAMHKGEFEESEKQLFSYWSFIVFQTQFSIAEAVYKRCQDPYEIQRVKDIRWKLADDITSYCFENRLLCSFIGGRIKNVLCYMIETHMEQSKEICLHGSSSIHQIASCLENMKKDCTICEEVFNKVEMVALRDVYNQLKHRIELHDKYYETIRVDMDIFIVNTSDLEFWNT
jgi:hypothetical protein